MVDNWRQPSRNERSEAEEKRAGQEKTGHLRAMIVISGQMSEPIMRTVAVGNNKAGDKMNGHQLSEAR